MKDKTLSGQKPSETPGDEAGCSAPPCSGSRRHEVDHRWHVAINKHSNECRKIGEDWPRFMYEAKTASQESERLALLFAREREGKLCKVHRQCSHSAPEPVEDNHLTCCLGKKCKECPHLLALEKADLPPEEIDKAKAWTCVAHILQNGGDVAGEGYLMTVDDRMFWDRVYDSMSYTPEDDEDDCPNVRGDSPPLGG